MKARLLRIYLHYDPYTRRQRGDEQVLSRQRMDFLMLLEHGVRIVIEVDGRHHYAVKDILLRDHRLRPGPLLVERQKHLPGVEQRHQGAHRPRVAAEHQHLLAFAMDGLDGTHGCQQPGVFHQGVLSIGAGYRAAEAWAPPPVRRLGTGPHRRRRLRRPRVRGRPAGGRPCRRGLGAEPRPRPLGRVHQPRAPTRPCDHRPSEAQLAAA